MIAKFLIVVVATLTAAPLSAQGRSGVSAAGLSFEASGAGDPVVLIHGFSLDRHMWDRQVKTLESRYRVVRYDLRGHGDSAAIEGPYTGYEDLSSVLDALAIDRATLVGLSAGAELAINFALTHPDRVARLILVAPGLGGCRGPDLLVSRI